MQSLADKLKQDISPKYHSSIDQIAKVLGLLEGITVDYFTNSVSAKNHVLKYTKDRAGYRIISGGNIVSICGNVEFKPFLQILSDFAIILVSSKYIDAANRVLKTEQRLVVFEKKNTARAQGSWSQEVLKYASAHS